VPGRNAGPSTTAIHITTAAGTRSERLGDDRMLFAFEAEAISAAIAAGLTEAPFPALSPADSIGNNTVLDLWRREVGYATFRETAVPPRLTGTMPPLPEMPMARIPGLDRDLSQFILGCDNRNTLAEGAILFDAWIEAGGNAFDTAFIYGGGRHEQVLGDWIRARGMADQVVVTVKGAHSPYCLPDVIGVQLAQSLDRLGIGKAPIYIMHRDNPAVPVGEFVEAVNREIEAGRIGVWGGSNWTPARFDKAVGYAAAHGLEPPRILNNNLSLAVMQRPVWPGCVTSNNPETLRWLRDRGVAHLSWSSTARGYFLPESLRNRLAGAEGPEECFGCADNAERRARAERLGAERGVSALHVAAAWVLAQPFPSFALIGPRSPGELASTLAAASVRLTPEDVAWLNLET
jgi:aryl-alcohol dehydrogenase-like predicted oxidoreductase